MVLIGRIRALHNLHQLMQSRILDTGRGNSVGNLGGMYKLKDTKILGFPLWMYLNLSVIMVVFAVRDRMLTNMIGKRGEIRDII